MAVEIDDVVSKVAQVDWNFTGASTLKSSIHSLHWFPGNFIPQIPAYLIQILSQQGDTVLDPFCGSGTTGVEAVLLGRNSWQNDVSTAALQVARGKLSAYAHGVPENLIELGRSFFFTVPNRRESPEGRDPELEHWFHKDTLAQLRFLWELVACQPNINVRNVLEMIFTDVLFRCASAGGTQTSTGKVRRHHWGWIADNVRPPRPTWHNAIDMFRSRIFASVEVIKANRFESLLETSILKHEDARELSFPSDSVDLVITSPPYLGMIDYALSNRLTYLWYGWPLKPDRNSEIGSRQKRTQKDAVCEYLEAMTSVTQQIFRVLRRGGYCAIVIGASRKYPEAAHELIKTFSGYLTKIVDPISRIPSRRRISERNGTDPVEYICVFQKT